jgi:hypothetical protein
VWRDNAQEASGRNMARQMSVLATAMRNVDFMFVEEPVADANGSAAPGNNANIRKKTVEKVPKHVNSNVEKRSVEGARCRCNRARADARSSRLDLLDMNNAEFKGKDWMETFENHIVEIERRGHRLSVRQSGAQMAAVMSAINAAAPQFDSTMNVRSHDAFAIYRSNDFLLAGDEFVNGSASAECFVCCRASRSTTDPRGPVGGHWLHVSAYACKFY